MPSFKDSFSGDTFKGKEMPSGWHSRLAISEVGEKTYKDEKTGKEDTKLILSFADEDKRLVCNWTNATEIAKSYGDDTDGWIGKVIQLYRTTTSYGTDVVPCIRVRGPKSETDAAPPPKSWGDAPEPERDDPGAAGEADPTTDW